MKNVLKSAVFVSSLATLNACGSNLDNGEKSRTAGLLDSSKLDFNFGSYLQGEVEKNRLKLPKYVSASSNGLSVGGSKSFLLTNNILYKSEVQKIKAEYYLDAVALTKNVTDGHLIEAMARAQTDMPELEYEVRVAGEAKLAYKATSLVELKYSRVAFGATLPIPIVPGLQLDLGGKVGGEMNIVITPNINMEKKSAHIDLKPTAELYGTVNAGVSAIFARAEAKGKVTLIMGSMPITGGVVVTNEIAQPTLRLEPLKLDLLDGKADLYASLSLGNVLPGPARELWKKIFGKGLEYTYPLIRWEGFDVLVTDAYEYPAKASK